MVKIKINDEMIEFEILDSHKIWTFQSSIKVKLSNIVNIYKKDEKYDWFPGWRVPGTNIPYLITAGTYFKNKEKHFWDVTNYKDVYVFELQNTEYKKLFLNIKNHNELEVLINQINNKN